MSIAIVTAALLANAYKTQYESDGGYCIRLYSTPRRAEQEDSIGAAILLCTVTNASGPLTWQTAVDELLAKTISEVWEGDNVASAAAVWGCLSPLTDTGAASTSIHRTDFSVGKWTDAPLPEYKMSDNVLILGQLTRFNAANLTFVRDPSAL